jgi:hypothetical protein
MKTPEEIKESNKLRDVITEILERRPGVGATYELLHLFENLMREKSSSQIEDLTKEVKLLKEKEIRGDRMIVDLEHQKTVLTKEVERLKREFDFAAKVAATQTEKLELAQHVIKSISEKETYSEVQIIAKNYLSDQSPEFEI